MDSRCFNPHYGAAGGVGLGKAFGTLIEPETIVQAGMCGAKIIRSIGFAMEVGGVRFGDEPGMGTGSDGGAAFSKGMAQAVGARSCVIGDVAGATDGEAIAGALTGFRDGLRMSPTRWLIVSENLRFRSSGAAPGLRCESAGEPASVRIADIRSVGIARIANVPQARYCMSISCG